MFYVEVNDPNSNFYVINPGTIQETILSPILYAIYVSPLFDRTDLSSFADDNFALTWHICKQTVKNQMQKTSANPSVIRRVRFKSQRRKKELCLFYKKYTHPIEITLNNNILKSNPNMNVLGVCFDSKLTWSLHIAMTINKANTALLGIRLIKKYFTDQEILQLITSNFYLTLYYNSEMWHLPSFKPEQK